jgi:hypothetical protein
VTLETSLNGTDWAQAGPGISQDLSIASPVGGSLPDLTVHGGTTWDGYGVVSLAPVRYLRVRVDGLVLNGTGTLELSVRIVAADEDPDGVTFLALDDVDTDGPGPVLDLGGVCVNPAVQVISGGTGWVRLEGSLDGINWSTDFEQHGESMGYNLSWPAIIMGGFFFGGGIGRTSTAPVRYLRANLHTFSGSPDTVTAYISAHRIEPLT